MQASRRQKTFTFPRSASSAAARVRRRALGRARGATACAALAWTLSAQAEAHPFGDRYAAQRVDVQISSAGVQVGFVADVPNALMPAAPDGRTPDPEAMLDELSRGLIVVIDGVSRSPEVVHRAQRLDLVSMDTRILELILRVDTPLAGAHTLEVTNGNLSGTPCYHLADIRLSPAVDVLRTSLLVPALAGRWMDFSGRWSRSELRRRVTADIEVSTNPFTGWVEGRAADTFTPLARREASIWEVWRAGEPRAAAVAGLGVAAALAGLGAGAARGLGARAVVIAAVAVLVLGAAWAPAPWRGPMGILALGAGVVGAATPLPRAARLALLLLVPVSAGPIALWGTAPPDATIPDQPLP